MKKTLSKAAIAALAVVALTFVAVTPASAQSQNSQCPNNSHSYTFGVTSQKATALSGCGLTVQVRILYSLPIGVLNWGNWKSGLTNVTVTPPAGTTLLRAEFKMGSLSYSMTP